MIDVVFAIVGLMVLVRCNPTSVLGRTVTRTGNHIRLLLEDGCSWRRGSERGDIAECPLLQLGDEGLPEPCQ